MMHATVSPRGLLAGLLFFVALAFTPCVSKAQQVSIVGTQRTLTATTQAVTAVACNAAAGARWAYWYPVSTQRNAMIRVTFVDADSSAANLQVRCETTSSTATAADGGQELPTLYSTTTTNNIAAIPWAWTAVGGGAPGSSTFNLQIANIPDAFIGCLFTCGAGGAAADNFTATWIGVNP